MANSRTLMAMAFVATMFIELAMAANYIVGDSDGWEIGTDFKSWASSKKFTLGDVLNFEYSPNHNVLEVTEPDFSSCESSNPIKTYTDGKTAITLSTPGKRYFICGVPGHCSVGMNIEIDTLATSSPTPPAPPPDSVPSPTNPPPEATPSSPPPNSTPGAPTNPQPPTPPPASPPSPATKPPAKTPSAPPPGFGASPLAPPTEPSSPSPSPSPSPTPESPAPPFPFDQPLNPTGAPTTPVKPPPPPSSAYKCSFRVGLSIGFSLGIIILLAP